MSQVRHTVQETAQRGGQNRIPTTELLFDVRRVTDDLGHIPTTDEYDEHGEYCYMTFRNREEFDVWTDVLWAAGLDPEADLIPIKDLRDAILKLSVELDKTPTITEMNEHGEYSVQAYRSREEFDYSWNGALEYAGLEPNRRTRKQRPSATGKGTRYTIVRKNATKISRLPDPMGDDAWFRLGEVGISQSLLLSLDSSGAVEGKKTPSGKKWKLKENIYEEAVQNAENTHTFACGCTGINNVPGGGIECSGCGIEYPREKVETVLTAQIS